MLTMEKKLTSCRGALVGLAVALALLTGSRAQGQPSRDQGGRPGEQGMRSAPGPASSPAPQMRTAPSAGLGSGPSFGPRSGGGFPSGGSVQVDRGIAPRMREGMAFANPPAGIGQPAPSFNAPSARRSFAPSGGASVAPQMPVRQSPPSVTYRFSPTEPLMTPQAGGTGSPSSGTGIPRNRVFSSGGSQAPDSALTRRITSGSDSPKGLNPGVTNRDGGVIFDSLSPRRENTSNAPTAVSSGSDRRSDSRGQAGTPTRSTGTTSVVRIQPNRSAGQDDAASADRSSLPTKSRPDSPTKVWSSRSVGSDNGAPGETKSRDPSTQLRERILQRRTDSAPAYSGGRLPSTEQVRTAGSEVRQSRELDSRLRQYDGRGIRSDSQDRAFVRERSTVVYHDRPDLIGRGPRYSYVYRDSHNRVFSRLIWPGYAYPVYYGYGSDFCVSWVYPYYQRRHMFVSLGGWWPYDYSYLRYYWYGWSPYLWYGYYPIPREIETSPDNYYYTYNYYNWPDNGYYDVPSAQPSSTNTLPYGVDNDTYAKIQAIIQKQKAGEPPAATDSDSRFEAGVESFEAGRYTDAIVAFADAMRLSPEDKILPFAYAQAFFAARRYSEAAGVLRVALQQVTPQQEGVFYPRGLYLNDDVLFSQVQQLLDRVETNQLDGDLQLLLGYQLMGIGEVEYARHPLEQASQDVTDARAAQVLLGLLDKMDRVAQSQPAGTAQTQNAQMPATGQPAGEENSAARSSLLNRVKSLDSTAPQPKTDQRPESSVPAYPSAAPPAESQSKDPNAVSADFNQETPRGGGEPSGSKPGQIAQAGLLQSTGGSPVDQRLAAATGAVLLVGGAWCLRRANQLAPHSRLS
jgi:thioredoxin-like negative regulator of GroEL